MINTTFECIDGKAFAEKIHQQVTKSVEKLGSDHNITPNLAVILVGENPASEVYVRNKKRKTTAAGMGSLKHTLPHDVDQDHLIDLIVKLNQDPNVHGILVQLPLPKHIESSLIINTIDASKDVDGFHTLNVGRLSKGEKAITPCTPTGCLALLKNVHGSLKGKHAVVVGRSNIVGKPMAHLLLQEDCTVTVVHSKSENMSSICQMADILVVAVGQPKMVKAAWVKPGATVIDVGINRVVNDEGVQRLVGDVDFDEVAGKAGAITPVPGGVGPVTIAYLLLNTLIACCHQNNIAVDEETGLYF